MTDLKAIESLEQLFAFSSDVDISISANYDALSLALNALREKVARDYPQPMTIEELRMRSESKDYYGDRLIWIRILKTRNDIPIRITAITGVDNSERLIYGAYGTSAPGMLMIKDYKEKWLAYDGRPGEKGNRL